MGDLVLEGRPPLEVHLRRSGRARRMTLRVSALDGRITLTVPNGVREREALAFAREKEAWMRRHLSRQMAVQQVGLGSVFPLEGAPLRVVTGAGRSVRIEATQLLVPGDPERAGARVAAFVKTRARARLAEASDRYARKLGRDYATLTLRDTRSRWGSCSSQGRLMYSWRLILAPPEVLEYVAAHEVAHLAEMNHSQRFWATVEELFGAYEGPRRWLHDEGASLHAYRFGH